MRSVFASRLAVTSVGLLSLGVLAGCGDEGENRLAAGAGGGSPAAVSRAAQAGCREDLLRQALTDAGEAQNFDYEITHLECADGFGWAVLDPVPENFDTGTALLGVTATGVEILDLGTSICTADHGIPPDVAARIAPPGADPAGDCPGPAPGPSEPGAPAEPGAPVEAEPDFTG